MDKEFVERLRQHYKPAELAEFLELTMDEMIEAFEEQIMDNYADLVDEILFDLDMEDEEDDD